MMHRFSYVIEAENIYGHMVKNLCIHFLSNQAEFNAVTKGGTSLEATNFD